MSVCTECKFPLGKCVNELCDCHNFQRPYCHVCTELHRVIFRSPYLSKLSEQHKADENERRRRMGL